MAILVTGSRKGKLPRQSSMTPARSIFLQASATVLLLTLLMILVTWSGIFDSATVELGLEHYAEKPLPWLPDCVPMPLNTAINFGYVLCACYWCFLVLKAHRDGAVKEDETYFFFIFNVMGFVYGFVQLYRIVMQTLCSAIMDQWYTLPFFMVVYLWAQSARGQGSGLQFYALMCASVLSYTLTLLTPVGFELSLAGHVLLAVSAAYRLYREEPTDRAWQCFVLGILSCSGFVALKLMDLYLPHVHWIFGYVSGHFLSKICDVLQFHFSNEFFFTVLLVRKSPRAVSQRKTKRS